MSNAEGMSQSPIRAPGGKDPFATEAECRKILGRNPSDPVARFALGKALNEQGRHVKAARVLRGLTRDVPYHAEAHEELAHVLTVLEHPADALIHFRRALRLTAAAPTTRTLDMLRRCVAAMNTRPDAWLLLGNALAASNRPAEAVEAYSEGLTLAPENGPLLLSMGNELRVLGRRDAAISAYESCLELYPSVGEAYFALANLKNYDFEPAVVACMEEQADDETLSDEARVNFHFALGVARERTGEYESAFRHFQRGNALRRKHEHFDAQRFQALVDTTIKELQADAFADVVAPGATDTTPTPIFIVGMPRSGSTLAEQILASHSAVEGTHELTELGRLTRRFLGPKAGPEAILELGTAERLQFGQEYIEATRRYCEGKPWFIDKMPTNFINVGLIRLVLPQAKIVHTVRDPLATCVSCYKQLFYGGHSYTYDLTELATYYVGYRRLMRHWHSVVPGLVFDLQYEDLVTDMATSTRRLLDYCGLPFEESCIRFHESERPVASASSEQVRRPLYSDSINAWAVYRPYLDELVAALAPELAG